MNHKTEPNKQTFNNGIDLQKIIKDMEIGYIKQALILTNGHKHKAAVLLGISFRSLRYKIAKYRITT